MKIEAETIDQRNIRLLSQFPEDCTPLFTQANEPPIDIAGFAELLDDDFIDGVPLRNEANRIIEIANMTITSSGRRHLESLQQKESLSTFTGFISAHRFSGYKWVFGILATLLVALALKYLLG